MFEYFLDKHLKLHIGIVFATSPCIFHNMIIIMARFRHFIVQCLKMIITVLLNP